MAPPAHKNAEKPGSIVAGGQRWERERLCKSGPFWSNGLDVAKGKVDQAERWLHEEADDGRAEEDHEDEAEDTHAVIGLQRAVGQKVAHNAAAVEWRQGQQVKEEEREVYVDCQLAKDLKGLHVGDDRVPVRQIALHQDGDCEADKSDKGQNQVRDRTRQRDEGIVANQIFEVAGYDGRRLGPTNEKTAHGAATEERPKDHHGRQDERAECIDVVHGVERDAALHAGGLIAKPGCHPGVRALMEAQGKNEQHKLKNSN